MVRTTPSALLRWILIGLSGISLIFGCIGSVTLLYGANPLHATAQMEANQLGSVVVSELVGSTSYQTSDDTTPHSIWSALSATLRLPLSNPMKMVTGQFPLASYTSEPQSGAQSSLFDSLSQWQKSTNKIAMGWIPTDTVSHTIALMQQTPGLTVVSPTWLSLNKDGSVSNQSQSEVVAYAHQHNIQVWAMFDNHFQASLTHRVLNNDALRAKVERNLLSVAQKYHLDGINVDFENVRASDEILYSTFIGELHDLLHPVGIKLSVDITPDVVFLQDNEAYFHAGLAEDCDYVILMAYDEHWGGDPTPGPVADVPWVTQSINDLLSTGVPADKLIMGLPFYARFWYVHKDGSVNSEAIASPYVDDVLKSHGAKSTWNDKLGVAYAEYPKPDGTEKVWYETPDTMNRKLSLVNNTGLAGVAIWSLSLSDSQTWNVMMQALRQSVS